MAAAAQAVYDSWDASGEDGDPDVGFGGICDEVSQAIGSVLAHAGIDTVEGGQEGDDHSFLYAYDDVDAYSVDIPPGVYERGSGYNWTKIEGVTITAEDVEIYEVRREDVVDSSEY